VPWGKSAINGAPCAGDSCNGVSTLNVPVAARTATGLVTSVPNSATSATKARRQTEIDLDIGGALPSSL
jgi:hypothetical protein